MAPRSPATMIVPCRMMAERYTGHCRVYLICLAFEDFSTLKPTEAITRAGIKDS